MAGTVADWQARNPESLTMWAIYDRPDDFPSYVVVRPWDVYPGCMEPGPKWLCENLEQARELLAPLALHRIDQQPEDDPKIVEVWF